MTVQLTEAGAKLAAAQQKAVEFFAQFDTVGDQRAKNMTGEDVAKYKAIEAEIVDLQNEFNTLKKADEFRQSTQDAIAQNSQVQRTPAYKAAERKTLADLALANGVLRKGYDRDMELDAKNWLQAKATMTTSANGYAPEVLRDGNVVPIIMRPPQVLDYLRMDSTTQNGIKFMKQSVRTNTAAAKSEGSAVDEATITYAESTDIISKIGVWIPVTQEQLEDEPGVRSLIDQDLVLMVRQELDRQVTVGNGSAPELRGIFNASSIASYAKTASESTADAIFKGIVKVNYDGRSNAGLIVLHATDHQFLSLTKTGDGVYLLLNPLTGQMDRLWGLPIVKSEALTATNALIFDPFYFRVKMRTGVNIAVSDSHSSNFTASVLAIRATVRAGIERLRDQAACKVTALPTS